MIITKNNTIRQAGPKVRTWRVLSNMNKALSSSLAHANKHNIKLLSQHNCLQDSETKHSTGCREGQQDGCTSRIASSRNLPVYEPKSIDIGTLEGVKVLHVDGFIKYFRSHVSGMARGTQLRTSHEVWMCKNTTPMQLSGKQEWALLFCYTTCFEFKLKVSA